jgi:hypothetical protein
MLYITPKKAQLQDFKLTGKDFGRGLVWLPETLPRSTVLNFSFLRDSRSIHVPTAGLGNSVIFVIGTWQAPVSAAL